MLQDGHSKWPEVRVVTSTTAGEVTQVLRSIFATWGLPEELVSDHGPPFNSVAFAEFLRKNHAKHKLTAVYHPSSNGQIERGVRTLKQGLFKQLMDDRTADRTLQHKIDSWLFTYRNTPHTLTKVSPAELFLGRRPRTPLSVLHPQNILSDRVQAAQEKWKEDHKAKLSYYKPGDLVWVFQPTEKIQKWAPGVVEGRVTTVSYQVWVKGRSKQVSVSHLRKRSAEASCEVDPTMVTERGPLVPVALAREFNQQGVRTNIPSTSVADITSSTPRAERGESVNSPKAVPSMAPPSSVRRQPQNQSPKVTVEAASADGQLGEASGTRTPTLVPAHRTRAGRMIVKPKRLMDYV